ncbi:MAG: PP2C family protein-serine/threonine phosphatase [Planctomycetota bacterium]|nr:PP2C family protein-serine/threonine phosphatase [Planctomycetota bacterium]
MASEAISEHELDLALASELQAALLPKACPHDCPHQVAAARNRMCFGVGGDFYDFLRLNEDQFALVIGDVVGHGVRASLVMAQIMGFFRSGRQKRSRPTEIISGLNEMLIELGDRIGAVVPCSIFYVVVDLPTGICFYINAGHHQPILCERTGGGVKPFGSASILLGVEEFDGEEMCHTFLPGERLVLYTDGIIETSAPDGEKFGLKRLRNLVSNSAGDTPDELADTALDALDEFRAGLVQEDDQTIVVVDRI